jgi:hypothetical protein
MATRPWFVAIDHRLLANDDPEADRTLALEGVRRALQKGARAPRPELGRAPFELDMLTISLCGSQRYRITLLT